jgi:uncharacterized protein involved in exopolysaccharide biosynthesis
MTESAGSNARRPEINLALEVWRRRRRLATVVVCPLLAGCVTFALSLPSMYRSTATLLAAYPQALEGFERSAVASELEPRLHAITEEILSRARLKVLMDRFNLYPELRGKREAAVERLWGDIKVKLKGAEESSWARPTMIAFSVSFRGRDPETVSRVTNALASFYLEENLKLREQARLARLRQELTQMQQVYSDQYPDVLRLKMEIRATERQLAAGGVPEGGEPVPRGRGDFQRGGDAGPEREQERPETWRRAEFRILDPAVPGWKEAAPNRIRLVFLGVLFTVCAAAAAVLLAEWLDTSFHSRAELRAFTRVPVLAEIPHIATTADSLSRRRSTAAAIAGGLALAMLVSYYFAHGNEQLVWMLARGAS